MTTRVRLLVAGRTFVEPAATTIQQDIALAAAYSGAGQVAVGLAQTSTQLEAELEGLMFGPHLIPLLARALVEERNGVVMDPPVGPGYARWLEELELLLYGVKDEPTKQAMGVAGAELLARFFGKGIPGSTTSPSSSTSPTPANPAESETPSPATGSGETSSPPSLDTIPSA